MLEEITGEGKSSVLNHPVGYTKFLRSARISFYFYLFTFYESSFNFLDVKPSLKIQSHVECEDRDEKGWRTDGCRGKYLADQRRQYNG